MAACEFLPFRLRHDAAPYVLQSFGFLLHSDIAHCSINSLVLRFGAFTSRRKNESGHLVTIQQEIGRTTAVFTVVACSRPGPMNLKGPKLGFKNRVDSDHQALLLDLCIWFVKCRVHGILSGAGARLAANEAALTDGHLRSRKSYDVAGLWSQSVGQPQQARHQLNARGYCDDHDDERGMQILWTSWSLVGVTAYFSSVRGPDFLHRSATRHPSLFPCSVDISRIPA